MSNVNRATISGRLAKDPEIKEFDNGNKVANMFLISNRTYYNKDKEKVEESVGIEIAAYGGLAKFAEYLNKGSFMAVSGRLSERSWEDKEGNKRKSYSIVADEIDAPKTGSGSEETGGENKSNTSMQKSEEEYSNEDVPF